MADHASPGTVAGVEQESGALGQTGQAAGPSSVVVHGRTVSWVAVSIIMAGFVAGGLGLILGPTWWLFWVGLAAAGVGSLLALATNIFEDWY